jgi:hypothetical protein
MRSHSRTALTLLEVVVAMAIFLVSLVAIYQLSSLGGERALDIQLSARTSMLCQSKLAEVTAGVEPMSSSGGFTNYPNEKDILWKMEATSGTVTGLWNVKVSVRAELPSGKIVESQLSQMVMDPTLRGSTLYRPSTAPANSTTPSASSPAAPAAPAAPAPAAQAPAGGGKGGGGGGGGKGKGG